MEWNKSGRDGSPSRPRRFRRKRPTFSRHALLSTPSLHHSAHSTKRGFTLVEVILVVVIAMILLGVALPQFSHTFKGSALRSAARTVQRMTRYARSMAILRETTMTVVVDGATMQVYLGGPAQTSTNAADGELDQAVLKRLGYTEGDGSPEGLGIEREIHRYLPDNLEVADFETEWNDSGSGLDDLYVIRYYPDGKSDWFILELEGRNGLGVRMENDPISGKIRYDFTQ